MGGALAFAVAALLALFTPLGPQYTVLGESVVRTLHTDNPRADNIRTFLDLPQGDLNGVWTVVEQPGGNDWGVVLVDHSGVLVPYLRNLTPATSAALLNVEGYLQRSGLPSPPRAKADPSQAQFWQLGAWGTSPLIHGVVIKDGETVWIVAYTM